MGPAYRLLTVTQYRSVAIESQHSTFLLQDSVGRVDLSRLAVSQAFRQLEP